MGQCGLVVKHIPKLGANLKDTADWGWGVGHVRLPCLLLVQMLMSKIQGKRMNGDVDFVSVYNNTVNYVSQRLGNED